jgi:hypothetical protein
MEHRTQRRSLIVPSAVGTALVTGAALVTNWVFEFSCTTMENPTQEWIDVCNVYPSGVSLLGIVAAGSGALAAWTFRARWLLLAGLILGLAVVVAPWIVYGDPAGNWDGLFV